MTSYICPISDVSRTHASSSFPSEVQLHKLSSRYFYCPGYTRIQDEISNNCAVCASLKQLPSELLAESTTKNKKFGTDFSADVIKRDGQLILLCREKLSQFTTASILPDEGMDATRNGLVSGIIETMPASGAVIKVDNTPALQALKSESETDGSILKKLNIRIELGRVFNKNKNPVAEKRYKRVS